MSLATRCTACGTVFRVVQDQLKVSEGWVRCGRCDEVFNALDGLFDLEREAPPASRFSAAAAAPASAPLPFHDSPGHADSGALSSRAALAREPSLADRMAAELLVSSPGDEIAIEPSLAASPGHASVDRWVAEPLLQGAAHPVAVGDDPFMAEAEHDALRAEPQGAPEFLRRADRQARWQHPAVRFGLGSTALLLLAGLLLQVAHHFRDTFAAQWPQARGPLLQWCAAIGCTLEPPRRIENISVESTTLARASATSDAFRLSVSLRNRGDLPLSVPSVDLKLTDENGALIARRMLSPRDFRITVPALAPHSETAMQLLLGTGTLGVTGYTVEVFYP